jgi:hypothetical protein
MNPPTDPDPDHTVHGDRAPSASRWLTASAAVLALAALALLLLSFQTPGPGQPGWHQQVLDRLDRWFPWRVQPKDGPVATPRPASPPPAAPIPTPAPSGVGVLPRMAENARSPEAPPPVARKCVLSGQTLFTDLPCPPGARSEALDLPASGPATTAASSVTLYRCHHHGGGHFWSTTHCRQQGSQVDRITSVPAELTLAQQIRLAEQRRLAVAPSRTPVATRPSGAAPPDASSANAVRCGQIERRIARIDSEARQPLSGSRQDRLRAERQDLRREQHSLRCA